MTKNRVDSPDIVLYTVEDIQKIFGIGRTTAYQMVSAEGFPTIRINRKIYIPKNRLEKWLEQNCGKTIIF
jgi:excisionase family DNA binding protein